MSIRNLCGSVVLRCRCGVCLAAVLAGSVCGVASGAGSPAGQAEAIWKTSGVRGGLVVHVGCGDGGLTTALRGKGLAVVQGLETDAAKVAAARERIGKLGLCGPVSVDAFDGKRLPYVDNLVNLLVAGDLGDVPADEAMRVLAPGGVLCVRREGKWTPTVKPRPKTIDEWTHYLHDPGNNAVAHDTVVGPPRHVQWLAGPRWTRHHHTLNSVSSVVTAAGRLFYVIDDATAANMSVPGRWSVVGRDAFSGVMLWKKPMPTWAHHRHRFRSGPPQVTRLLVASPDRLYVPLGLSAPVSALGAATGETLATYAASEGAEEIVLAGETLLVLRGSPVAEQAIGHAAFKGQYKVPNRKSIVAIATKGGKTLWQWSGEAVDPRPETLAADAERVYFQLGEGVVCLDLRSGKEVWTFGNTADKRRPKRIGFGRHVLVVVDGVVLCPLSGTLTALSAADGKKLWDCPGGRGFHAPPDLFVIGGQVWQGLHPKDSVAPPPVSDFNEARDLRTGEAKRTNRTVVDIQTAGHHHRCYRNKATDRYILTGKRGVEMMDLAGENHSRNNWVRGTCQYGIMPANGLIYAPPHSCGCYPESLLWGFWALSAASKAVGDGSREVPAQRRLEKGPAYGKLGGAKGGSAGGASWAQFRGDALRRGVAGGALPGELAAGWTAEIGGRLSQPVVAGGRVLVAAIDAHAVCALDEKTGKVVWRRTVGGRVDSPPAVHGGAALFGCADGWIYCLRLSDGELAWRFRAARADVRTVSLDQVESVWPAHGSVLLLGGVAYCSAGRSTWLDGGIDLYGLDPATGAVVHSSRFASRHPVIGEGKDKARPEHNARIGQTATDYRTYLASDRSDSFSMAAGAVTDVLVSDGTNVFLHQTTFNAKLEKQAKKSRHLFSTSGLLDGRENHRSHWVLGTGDFSRVPVAYSWIVNRGGWRNSAAAVPFGVLMVYNDRAVWVARRDGAASGRYSLLMRPNKPFSPDEPSLPDFRNVPKGQAKGPVWQVKLPVRPRAMLKAAERLYLGCMPPGPLGRARAGAGAAAGAKPSPGTIRVVSAADGSDLGQWKLDSPPVFDGMAAANGRLFVSTEAGRVRCWAAKGSSQ